MGSNKLKHGESKNGGRWCETHNQFHGDLYPCPEYPKEVLQHLEKASEQYISNLRSRSWCNKQIADNKIPAEGIQIFRALAGIDIDDWTA